MQRSIQLQTRKTDRVAALKGRGFSRAISNNCKTTCSAERLPGLEEQREE